MKFSPILTILASSLFAASSASAAIVTYHGSFTVTSSGSVNPVHIAVGDVFYYELAINTAAVDTDSSTLGATFPDLFSNFRLAAASTNTGSWNPATTGTWSPSDGYADKYSGNELRGLFYGSGGPSLQYMSMDGPGDPENPGGGWQWTNHIEANPHIYAPYTDNGSGQTFAQMFGTLDPSAINPFFGFGGGGYIETTSTVFAGGSHPLMTPVPEPSGVLLFGCGLAGFALRRRRAN